MSGVHILQDDRVLWMRQRVAMALELPTESFDSHLMQSEEMAQMLGDFMTANYSTGSAIFFSCDKWVEEVEVEESDIDGQNTIDEMDLVDSITGSDIRASPSEETKSAVSAAGKVLVKRNVDVDRYTLFLSVEKMTPKMNNRPTAFFIRSNDGDVPKWTGGHGHPKHHCRERRRIDGWKSVWLLLHFD